MTQKLLVSPINKGLENENKKSIYRPDIVLDCFYKIYETVIKMQLDPFLESQFPLFLVPTVNPIMRKME